MLRGNICPASYLERENRTANNDRVATQVLINHSKALQGIRDQSNNISVAILSIINYIIRANLYLIPETARSSLQFALMSRCEKLPVVFTANTPSSYLQFETTVKKISDVCISRTYQQTIQDTYPVVCYMVSCGVLQQYVKLCTKEPNDHNAPNKKILKYFVQLQYFKIQFFCIFRTTWL